MTESWSPKDISVQIPQKLSILYSHSKRELRFARQLALRCRAYPGQFERDERIPKSPCEEQRKAGRQCAQSAIAELGDRKRKGKGVKECGQTLEAQRGGDSLLRGRQAYQHLDVSSPRTCYRLWTSTVCSSKPLCFW